MKRLASVPGPLSFFAALAITLALPANARAADFSVVHAFPLAELFPGKLLVGNDGATLYGTTVEGGQYGGGALFRIGLDGGGYSIVHSFRRGDPSNGASPATGTLAGRAGLVQGADGTLYGTTQEGGLYNLGTVYEVRSDGSGWRLLHSFTGQSDGATPYAGLLMGRDGMLYGVASQGGLYGDGVIFRVAPGQSGSQQVVHQFDHSDPNNGALPFTELVQDSAGTLYGTTWQGGVGQDGVVFRMAPDGGQFTVLYAFPAASAPDVDGPHPSSGLLLGSDGFLYGTTVPGGVLLAGDRNSVFRLSRDGTSFATVYAFGGASDGIYPLGGLMQGTDGALYGTTSSGGTNGHGTLFRLTSGGSFSVLHAFGAPWGAEHGVVQAPDGNLYGCAGSPSTRGVLFKINPAGGELALVHSFVINEGNLPIGGVILGRDGALYGTTVGGGNAGNTDFGTVFRMNPDGSGFTVIHSFDSTHGASPSSALVQGSDGTLFGTTTEGGPGASSSYQGVVYALSPDGTYQVLHGFTGPDGSLDASGEPLLLGADGSLYGTSMLGSASLGEVFRITSAGVYQTLHAFSWEGIQGFPSSIIWGPGGLLYGLTVYDFNLAGGGVFSLAPSPDAQPTFLHQFSPATEGGQSRGPLVLGADGALYGTTTLIGDFSTGNVLQTGTIFKLQPDGSGFQVLYVFSGGSDGATPVTLMQGRDGRLYGTTYYGGESNVGVFFAVNSDGSGFEVLHSFEPSGGAYPYGALLETVDGSFYGVASTSGPRAGGVVYRMSHVTCPGTPICSGHGTCGNGVCTCQAGYTGADCAQATCPGIPVCSGHGTCNGTICTCNSGYTGADCSTVTCPGIPVCSGHGTCNGTICTCNSGYTGPSCSVATCPGIPVCSGHGTCNGTICTCNSGYTGPSCLVTTCPGTPVCSGHGTCSNGTCTCQLGYSGPSCSVYCAGNSSCPNGTTCNNNNQCGSRVCIGNKCVPPGCAPHCNPGATCGANSDCGSQVCTNSTCAPPACSPTCGPAAVCGNNADCLSRTCVNNLCVPPSCSPRCNQGATCGANSDCGSKVCVAGTCRAPACSPTCSAGAACGNNNDCRSRTCNNYVCR